MWSHQFFGNSENFHIHAMNKKEIRFKRDYMWNEFISYVSSNSVHIDLGLDT